MELDSTQKVILRIGALIAAFTVLLWSAFIGLVGVAAGDVTGFEDRVPWYIVLAAVAFVATIVLLELNDADGKTIIVSAFVVGVFSLILTFLGFEGFRHLVANPRLLFDSQLVLYFFAAALVATGLGYWGLRHWREFTAEQPDSL